MNHTDQNDEITFKSLILKIKEYWKELWKKWWVVVLSIIVVSIPLMYQHSTHEVKFIAPLKFIIEGDNGGGGMLGGILGQIGIRKGSVNNPYKIMEVARSNRITSSILSTKYQNSNLANAILDSYNLPLIWSETNSDFAGFKFSEDSIILESRTDKIAFYKLKSLLLGGAKDRSNALLNFGYDEDSAIYNISAKAKNEDLSIFIANTAYDRIRHFFEDELLADRLKSIKVLNGKADSLSVLRTNKNYELALFLDRNSNTVSKSAGVKANILQQDIQAVSIAYGEVLKNKEFAELSFSQQKPMFVMIDGPLQPLAPILSLWYIALIKSIIVGGFFGLLIIVLSKTYRDIMNS